MADCRPWALLAPALGGRLRFNAPLAPLATFGVGGPATVLARPDTETELAAVLDLARREGLPRLILGGGSNILFADEGFEGLVVKLGQGFQAVEPQGRTSLAAGAGASSARVLEAAAERGLAGLEGLAGIPGTIGGAVFMNAGGFGREVGPAVARLRVLDGDGRLTTMEKTGLRFEYRRLHGLPEGAVILGVEFDLAADRPEAVRARVREALDRRSQTQPRGLRSAGSVFKNPPGLFAGRLIEDCGLKGFRIGGAEVSEVHANFIVNRDGAKSRDILDLVRHIQAAVQERHGVALETEIKIIDPRGGEMDGHDDT